MSKLKIEHMQISTDYIYMIVQIILVLWLLLSYDLLQDRRTIGIIITKFLFYHLHDPSG